MLNQPRKLRYQNLKQVQKDELCNGCGGKGGIVTPPHAEFFKEECNWHDFNYFLGYTEQHRKKADLQLLRAMQKKCKSLGWFNKIRLLPWCYVYYKAVRLVGKRFFYYGNKEQALYSLH